MARTLSAIYNSLVAGKESDSTLDTLLPNPDNWSTLYTNANFNLLAQTIVKSLSVSKVAIWRLFIYIVAYAIWVHETLWDQAEAEIDALTLNRVFGQLPWYVEQAKAFQYGDDLVFNGDYYEYETIDDTKQIVTQASATNVDGVITLKLAKGTVGSLSALTATELAAVETYFKGTSGTVAEDGIAPAGTKLSIISTSADTMKMQIDVFVDPLVIDTNGILLSDGVTKPVETAITNYIQQLPFNAVFKIVSLVDAIQAVDGVENVVVNFCDARYGTNPFEDITAATGRKYTAFSGYLAMETNYDLDEYYDYPANTVKTLNYIAA